jgi:hypothetical protein
MSKSNDFIKLRKKYEKKLYKRFKIDNNKLDSLYKERDELYEEIKKSNVEVIIDLWNKIHKINNKIKELKEKKNKKILLNYYKEIIPIFNYYLYNNNHEKIYILEFLKIADTNEYLKILKNKGEKIKCLICQSKTLIQTNIESYLYCENCKNLNIINFGYNNLDKEHSNSINYFECNYQKINYYKIFLDKLRQKKHPSDEIIEEIKNELKKQYIEKNDLTPDKMRYILKKMKYNKLYNDIIYIMCKINNINLPHISNDDIEKMKVFFIEVDKIWNKVKKNGRRSFMNYSYYIYKTLQLISSDGKYDAYFKYLKISETNKNIELLDSFWMKICKKLNVKYYPTYL